MTLHITNKRPERYACERCACEIGVNPDPRARALIPHAYGVMSTIIQPDDDPMVFDDDCPCNCHEFWNLVHHKPAGDAPGSAPEPEREPAPTKKKSKRASTDGPRQSVPALAGGGAGSTSPDSAPSPATTAVDVLPETDEEPW